MKGFWKYAFPPLYGLLIYFSIRVVTDTTDGTRFWLRPWLMNTIEIVLVVSYTFFTLPLFNRLVNRFSQRTRTFELKEVMQEFVIVILVILATVNPLLYLVHYLIHDPVSWSDFSIANVVAGLYTLLYYAIARGNKFVQAYIDQQLQLERITNDQLQTELKFLKAQYHPHFLFNALNTIYFQMDENIGEAKKSIEQFSGLLRYQLYDQQQMVEINKELNYLQQFIELQQKRSSEKLRLTVHFDDSLKQQLIYPLLLLPLVENAFKYAGGNWTISIHAGLQNNQLHFAVENAVPAHIPEHAASGIGLENLRRRLQLLYPGQASIETTKENQQFKALLILPFGN
ncbi:histidine kinase [Pseudoflavitalea sp. G-6-1-2]|uniref:sensor histidine kinase n=1 Tax=Pseudoflavitalea sp. G-6-1-2 TaxID=2728841 RepID=UPI00146D6017|nr:histidine kinase [Pseudoflavitalea sp. G-6-1-2]NML21558.1 histidine kinase [Pseudoflavitalea sp. G-6-1-2]